MTGTKARRWAAAMGGAGVAALLAAVPLSPAAAEDPPGNNGTVKIDGVAFDVHPDNEPHVGCEFQVDFYGFDEGDLTASVLFEAIPPTSGDAVPPGSGQELLTDEVDIGEDPAGGGTDLDAERTYDLTEALAGIEPHPQQGWHVQLTVHAEGSIGADTKHKVFWVTGCEVTPPPSSSTTTSTSTSTTSTTSTPDGSTTTTTTTTTPGDTTTTTSQPSSGNGSAGSSTSAPGDEGELPRTGSNVLPLAIGALVLISLGTGLVLARRANLGTSTNAD